MSWMCSLARAMESWDAELTSSAIENSIRILEKAREIVEEIQHESASLEKVEP